MPSRDLPRKKRLESATIEDHICLYTYTAYESPEVAGEAGLTADRSASETRGRHARETLCALLFTVALVISPATPIALCDRRFFFFMRELGHEEDGRDPKWTGKLDPSAIPVYFVSFL